jgi:hypothetical protein
LDILSQSAFLPQLPLQCIRKKDERSKMKNIKKLIIKYRMRREILKNKDQINSLSIKREMYRMYLEKSPKLNPETFRALRHPKSISPINRHDITNVDFEKLNENDKFDKLVHPGDLRKDLSKYGHTHSSTSATDFMFKYQQVFYYFEKPKED